MKNLTAKQILDKAMGMRDFFNEADEKKILKAMEAYAVQEAEYAFKAADSKAIDDHEFNLHQHWKKDSDIFDGGIKHFQD